MNIDANNLETINYLSIINNYFDNLYYYVYKMFNVNREFREYTNTLLIKDDILLKLLLLYITKYNVKINIDSCYFNNLFTEWNMEEVSRTNIILFIQELKLNRKKIMNESIGIYLNKMLSINYLDENNKIVDMNAARDIIINTKTITYLTKLSPLLYNINKKENLELLILATNKHKSVFIKFLKMFPKIILTNNQIIELVKNNPDTYLTMCKHYAKHTSQIIYDNIEEVILSNKYIYDKIIYYENKENKENNSPYNNTNFIDNLIQMNDKYKLNLCMNSNKNYVYNVLCYICNDCKNKDILKIYNGLKNNKLFIECYKLFNKHIKKGYKIFENNETYKNNIHVNVDYEKYKDVFDNILLKMINTINVSRIDNKEEKINKITNVYNKMYNSGVIILEILQQMLVCTLSVNIYYDLRVKSRVYYYHKINDMDYNCKKMFGLDNTIYQDTDHIKTYELTERFKILYCPEIVKLEDNEKYIMKLLN